MSERFNTEVLIVGTGISGLIAAIKLSERYSVTILSKSSLNDCSTAWAQGGIAAVIDNEDNIAYINNGFNIVGDDVFVTGNTMVLHIDDNVAYMQGDLIFEQLPSVNMDADLDEQEKELRKESSFLHADTAKFIDKKNSQHLFVSGNVKLQQSDKQLHAKEAIYEQARDYFEMAGYVQIHLDSLAWLLDEKTKKELSNKDLQQSVFQETSIRCDKLIFDSNKKQTKLLGNVEVTQPDKTISCKKLILHDETATVECFGSVKMIKDTNDMIQTEY